MKSELSVFLYKILPLVFIVWCIVYAGHAFIWFYSDDYLYASSAYPYIISIDELRYAKIGMENIFQNHREDRFFINIISFLYYHYMEWGGRVTGFAMGIPFMAHGPKLFFFVQSLIVTGIIYFTACIGASGERKTLIPCLVAAIIVYISFPFILVRDGLYWASASVTYVWPLFFLLAGYSLHIGLLGTRRSCLLIAACFFWGSASNELLSLAALGLVAGMLLLAFRNGNVVEKKRSYIALMGALAGFVFLYAAPGNAKRLLITMRDNPSMQHIFSLSEILKYPIECIYWIYSLGNSVVIIFLMFIIAASINIALFMRRNATFRHTFPLTLAWLVPWCILIFPVTHSPRCLVPQYFFGISLLIPSMIYVYKIIIKKNIYVFLIFSFMSFGYIQNIIGYYENYNILKYNHDKIKNNKYENIILKKYNNVIYCQYVPYGEYNFRNDVEYFIKRYYRCEPYIKFIYK